MEGVEGVREGGRGGGREGGRNDKFYNQPTKFLAKVLIRKKDESLKNGYFSCSNLCKYGTWSYIFPRATVVLKVYSQMYLVNNCYFHSSNTLYIDHSPNIIKIY